MDLNNAASGGGPVPYLSKEDRQRYEVTVGDNGLLYQKNEGGEPQVMDTSDGANPNGAYLFAMSRRGSVYAAPSTEVQHHSAFLAGNPGAAFGAIGVDSGKLQSVSDQSGHYQPTLDHSQQFPKELEARGVDLKDVETRYGGVAKKTAKAVMQPRPRLYRETPVINAMKLPSDRPEIVEAEVPDAHGDLRTLRWQTEMKRY